MGLTKVCHLPLMFPTNNFQPIRLLEIELTKPLPAISALNETSADGEHIQSYQQAISLVRLHNRPLGIVKLTFTEHGLQANEYARQIEQTLGAEIAEHLHQDGLPLAELTAAGLGATTNPPCLQACKSTLSDPPLVSIIVATRDRTQQLKLCIQSLLALNYSNYEIIIVDSAPSNDATAQFIQQTYQAISQIRYIHAKQPGLAVAHNAALPIVNGEFVAITDDDVQVDTHWLTEIVTAFKTAANVACVTGMILPMELETSTQQWIEQFGFAKGFHRRLFNLTTHRPPHFLFPYAAGTFGSGANMSFRTSALQAIGGFDSALGAGSFAMGGDDLAAFFEVISRGYTLVYEPAAFLRHLHRRDYPALRRQAYGYGVGLTAYLTKVLLDHPTRLGDFIWRAPSALAHLFKLRAPNSVQENITYPAELRRAEWLGMLHGPFRYIRSRSQSRKQTISPPHHPAPPMLPHVQHLLERDEAHSP